MAIPNRNPAVCVSMAATKTVKRRPIPTIASASQRSKEERIPLHVVSICNGTTNWGNKILPQPARLHAGLAFVALMQQVPHTLAVSRNFLPKVAKKHFEQLHAIVITTGNMFGSVTLSAPREKLND